MFDTYKVMYCSILFFFKREHKGGMSGMTDDSDLESTTSAFASMLTVGSSVSMNARFTRRSSKRSSPYKRDELVIGGPSSADIRGHNITNTNSSTNNGFRNGRDKGEVTDETGYSQLTGKDGRRKVFRACPLPPVMFADSDEVWEVMCDKEVNYNKSPELFKNHPKLGPQMRATLIEWLMSVCESKKLHRQTLYLAIDYLDRYLAATKDIAKHEFQLLGEGINRTVASISFQTKLQNKSHLVWQI
jgi:hypothetical protein